MITPFFSVTQDDEFIHIKVKIAHVRFQAGALEMVVDNDLFVFSMSPYYLRLRFPAQLIDDERSTARFDSTEGTVCIQIPKLVKGTFFEDLDLPAKLLARVAMTLEGSDAQMLIAEKLEDTNKGRGDLTGGEYLVDASGHQATDLQSREAQDPHAARAQRPLIEEVDVNNIPGIGDDSIPTQLEDGEQHDWEITQTEANDPGQDLTNAGGVQYGFNNAYSSSIGVSCASGNDINELGDPETTPPVDRVIERLIKENIKFDMEYYAADYIMHIHPSTDDDKAFEPLLLWKNPHALEFSHWFRAHGKESADQAALMPVEFTDEEQRQMLDLPRKSYLVDPDEKSRMLMTIVSLLFAYLFELRENTGDHTVESAWTVGKLTPQFAALDSLLCATPGESLLRAAVLASTRRALAFPLHRSFALVTKVWEDVYLTLRGGKRSVLRALLAARELFRCHDIYYVYDIVWCRDLCAWLVSDGVDEKDIALLARDLRVEYTKMAKTDVVFEKAIDEENFEAYNLQEIEEMAQELFAAYQETETGHGG